MRVLQSVRRPGPTTNPYLTQLVRAVRSAGVDVDYFTWRQGLFGRYDLLHVHWPEFLVRRDGRVARAAAQLRFALLLGRLRVDRTPVVRTLHNPSPHEAGGRLERALLRECDRLTTHWVLLNRHTRLPVPGPATVVPHGHYADWYAGHPTGTRVPGRVLTFGLLRPFKGTDALLAATMAVPDPEVTLRVVGRPVLPEMRVLVEDAVTADQRITAVLDHIDDATLAAELGAAQLVVLPYRQLHNSGALLLALSLHRPVLVPDNPATAELAAEVGPEWVHRYRGEFTSGTLVEALAATREPPAVPPDLSRREWPLIGAAYADAYRAAVAARRGQRLGLTAAGGA